MHNLLKDFKRNNLKLYDRIVQYAVTIACYGIPIQNRPLVVLLCTTELFEFAQILVEQIFLQGAIEIVVQYKGGCIDIISSDGIERFSNYEFQEASMSRYNKQIIDHVCFINLVSAEVDSTFSHRNDSGLFSPVFFEHFTEFPCCTVAVPSSDWAHRAFPNDTCVQSINNLWEVILELSNIDETQEGFLIHLNKQKQITEKLNSLRLKNLCYISNANQLRFVLPPDHIWVTGYKNGYCLNIPLREIYTAPDRYRVEGSYSSCMPIESNGEILRDIKFYFEMGKPVQFDDLKNESYLKKNLCADSGAKFVGEIALIFDSFYKDRHPTLNSLLDENIYCHFALGNAYKDCIVGGNAANIRTLLRKGINFSSVHIDFLFEQERLSVFGETSIGESVAFIINGSVMPPWSMEL